MWRRVGGVPANRVVVRLCDSQRLVLRLGLGMFFIIFLSYRFHNMDSTHRIAGRSLHYPIYRCCITIDLYTYVFTAG